MSANLAKLGATELLPYRETLKQGGWRIAATSVATVARAVISKLGVKVRIAAVLAKHTS